MPNFLKFVADLLRKNRFCICNYKTFINEPVSTWSTILEFLFSFVISIFGVTVNYRFRKKLQEERRNRPIDRKGNVIEPVMRWHCILQILYWPYELLWLWISFNEIIPTDHLPNWLCNLLYTILIMGRRIISYNSLFIALVRYLYIVHWKRANQWDFERTGKRFQIASIAIPVAMQTIAMYVDPLTQFSESSDRFVDCIASYQGLNGTANVVLPRPVGLELTLHYLPAPLVVIIYYISETIAIVVGLNLVEVYLYYQIFQSMHR